MRILRLLSLASLVLLASTPLLWGNANGPLPKLTGGFAEQTCIFCHNSYALNEGRTRGGEFRIEGIPRTYAPGTTYPITVVIGQPGQSRWGFELSVRFTDTSKQAGRLAPADALTQTIESGGIQYIEHTAQGTRPRTADGLVEFHFNWIAPETPGGVVLFNAAGNAANFSNNPEGDYIYTAGSWSGPAGEVAQTSTPQAPKKEQRWGERVNDTSKVIDLPAPVHLRKGAFEMHIQHRFVEALADSSPGDAFGIDSGANINLGVNYALTNKLSFGLSRARFDSVIALNGTYEIETKPDSFWKMSVLAGVEGQRNFERQYSPYLQITTALNYKGLRLYAVPTAVFHSRDKRLVNQSQASAINSDSNNTFSLGLGTDIALNSRVSLVGEIVPRLAGFGGFDHHRPTASAGLEIRTWGHVFSLIVSSSRDFTPAKYAVNPAGKDVSLGFNIYRKMR